MENKTNQLRSSKSSIKLVRIEKIIDEISYEQGDLILVKPTKLKDSLVLGVLKEYSETDNLISINSPRRLHPEFSGIRVPLVSPYGWRGMPSNDISYILEPQWTEKIWVGKPEVLRALRNRKSYSIHLDWISKLNKPYIVENAAQ